MGKIKALIRAYRGGIGLLGLLFVALSAIWLTFQFSKDFYKYWQWDGFTIGFVEKWEVAELGSDAFALKGVYRFTFEGKEYQAESLLLDPVYRSEYAAGQHVKEFVQQDGGIWFQKSHPENSTLYRAFPIKKAVYALLSCCVLGYFLFIKKYIIEVAK